MGLNHQINFMKTMTKAKHYGSRISQRGIRETSIALALRYGIPYRDKFVLGRKQIGHVIQLSRRLIASARSLFVPWTKVAWWSLSRTAI